MLRMNGLVSVEFAVAYVNDILNIYATVVSSPSEEVTVTFVASINYHSDQKIAQIPVWPPIVVPPNFTLFPIGGSFRKVQGENESLSKVDLAGLTDIRSEITWFEDGNA